MGSKASIHPAAADVVLWASCWRNWCGSFCEQPRPPCLQHQAFFSPDHDCSQFAKPARQSCSKLKLDLRPAFDTIRSSQNSLPSWQPLHTVHCWPTCSAALSHAYACPANSSVATILSRVLQVALRPCLSAHDESHASEAGNTVLGANC